MNNTYRYIRRGLGFTGALLGAVAFAQDSSDDDEEVFELSPFSVDGSQDTGYNASQTMAGGRLNQELKNTGASIQVITKDFMDDIGATGVEELLQYTTSSEVAGILGNFTGASTEGGGEVSTGGARRDPDSAARIRGLAAPDRTRNFFITEIPFDSYNTERIDINRGANSFLFGLGTPAGLLNNGLAQARFRDTNEISFRVGSGGDDPSYRANFKVNRVLAEDKLAVLVAGLYDRTEYRQQPTYRDDDRIYTALTFRPFKNANTEIKAHLEIGEQVGNAPDVLLPQHNLNTFLDGGAGINYLPSNIGDFWTQEEIDDYLATKNSQADVIARMSLNAHESVVFFNNQEGPANQGQINRVLPGGAWNRGNRAFDFDVGFLEDYEVFRNIPYSGSIAGFNWGAGALGLVYDGSNGEDPSFGYVAQLRGNDYARGNDFWDPINRGGGAPQMFFHGNTGEVGISGWQDQGFTDLETFDFSRNNLGWDNDYYLRDFYNYNFSISQSFWEGKGGFNLAYDYQDLIKGSYTAFNGGNARVIFDNNTHLLLPSDEYLAGEEYDGTNFAMPNPNYGRPFVITKSGRRHEDLQDETFRGTLFFKYDFQDSGVSDTMANILGSHTITFLADKSTSDEQWINYVVNSFGNENYDPGLHIGPANARQSANNARNTPRMVYVGPQQMNAFVDPDFAVSDFILNPAQYDIIRPDGETMDRYVWYLGDDVTSENFSFRGANRPDGVSNPINGNEEWRWESVQYKEVPTKNYRLQQTKITSLAVNTQSSLFSNHLIANMGYREDTIENWLNTEARLLGDDEIADLSPDGWNFDMPSAKFSEITSSVFGYGGVVYWPKDIVGLPEWIDDITFHYNSSENFVPATDRVDQYRNKVESPSGDSKDWGVSFYMMNDKVVARFNWYDAVLLNDRSPVSNLFNQTNSSIFAHFGQLNQDILEVDANEDGVVDDEYLIETHEWDPDTDSNPEGESRADLIAEWAPYLAEGIAARANIEPHLTDELKAAYNFRLLPNGAVNTQWAGQITDTNDVQAEGFEAEIIVNPTKSWRIAFNAAKQETTLTNIAPRLTELFEETWIPHLALYGDLDWNNPLRDDAGNNTRAQLNSRMIDYFVAKAEEGKPTGEQRKWRVNVVTNYQFREGRFKGFQFGGAYRWQDKYNSGYPLLFNEDGWVVPDVDNAFQTDSQDALDLTFGYRKKIFDNKVDWTLRFNLRNVHNWDNTDLTINKYQPDGSVARVRYDPPRQVLMTNTFKF